MVTACYLVSAHIPPCRESTTTSTTRGQKGSLNGRLFSMSQCRLSEVCKYRSNSLFGGSGLDGSGPTYLKDLLTPYTPTRNLRSANKDTLVIPKVTTKAYGQRSYQFAAPHLWNNLPLHIKQATTISSFKTLLKTYLFKSSYT